VENFITDLPTQKLVVKLLKYLLLFVREAMASDLFQFAAHEIAKIPKIPSRVFRPKSRSSDKFCAKIYVSGFLP